ncbi:MAG: ISL3 family transposase [Chloroflexi bacterium]|uniref:ISL3 family transposase n=1 Tax=Candidatus Chlorohelix allophototropha TaxID=3003348 RepID=A0A8T7M4X3_9CHLR|nr:ISL3 family transposase [Chloroflexota bacterium]WJW70295.1 ISL3 family transposase [Chloroflexota bacterium L227-S17]
MTAISIDLESLLPELKHLHLDRVEIKSHLINLELVSTNPIVLCPLCGNKTRQVHSHYTRRVEDLPWNAISVLLTLKLRRFFCINPSCKRKIFVERLAPTIAVYARRTGRLWQKLTELAFELGGQAGASVSDRLGMGLRPSSLLRSIRRSPLPQEGLIKMVGIDDWAIRKGQAYGTIVIDLERHRPVALLPDRTKETVVSWLEKHPEIALISRDRASAYSQAAALAAPQAVQVADKFHLLQNLAEMLQRVFEGNSKALGTVALRIAELEREDIGATSVAIPPLSNDENVKLETVGNHTEVEKEFASTAPVENQPTSISQRQLNFEQVKELHQQGYSQRAIATHLGLHRKTVKRYTQAEQLPKRDPERVAVLSSVTPYLRYLTERWQSGFYNKRQLWLEIREQGYTGTVFSVYRAMAKFPAPESNGLESSDRLPKLRLRLRPLSARRATWLLLHEDKKLKPADLLVRQVLLQLHPQALAVQELAQRCKVLLREHLVKELDEWLLLAKESHIGEFERFAASLERDYEAVKAGVALEISNERPAYCTSCA